MIARSLVIAALCIADALAAQQVGGIVLDRGSRRPVRDLLVVGIEAKTDTALLADSTRTDSSGTFYLLLPSAGPYRLRFYLPGYEPMDGGGITLKDGEFFQQQFLLDLRVEQKAFFDFEVDREVALAPGNQGPRYPLELRERNREGHVLVQFVVDASGRAELHTLKVLKSSHELFTQSVMRALWGMRFIPAEKDGQPVRQLVQQPFNFTITRARQ
jgi:TonB family protein